MIVLVISLVINFFLFINFILNGKTKYWEIFSIIPSIIEITFILLILLISIITSNDFGIIFNILSVFLLFPYLDFSFNFEEKSSGNIKILDLNTLFLYPKSPKELANYLINEFDPDIFCLQEFYTFEIGKETIPTGYIEKSTISKLFPNYYVETSYERGLISKYPIELIKENQFNIVFGYSIFIVKINDKDLYVFNVHMPFEKDSTFGYEIRNKAFNDLLKDIKTYKSANYKILVTGDFNSTKSSYFIQEIFAELDEAISLHGVRINVSWNIKKIPFWRLDFMFFNKSLNFRCTNSNFISNKKYSDHKGIISDFII